MNEDTINFLHDLFARCQTRAFLTFSAIHPDGDRPTPSRHVQLGDEAALHGVLAHLAMANRAGWGAYFGVATRQHDLGRWSRGGKSELTELTALFVDIDQPENALPRLGWFDLPASCILHSGQGYHAYWFLETPTTDFAAADKAIRGLAQHLGGDEALSVAQSMRLPGTINTKRGRNFALCHFVSYHPARLYTLGEFAPFIAQPMRYRRQLSSSSSQWSDQPASPETIEAVTEAVLNLLEGHWRQNGFIAARCPLPHHRDKPGMHFSYQPETGWGYCFGKHGKIPLVEMCRLLGVHDWASGNKAGYHVA